MLSYGDAKMSELLSSVAATVKEIIGRHDIEVSEELVKSGLIDSFGILQLILEIEQKFGINYENEDLDATNFSSIQTISDLVARKQQHKNKLL